MTQSHKDTLFSKLIDRVSNFEFDDNVAPIFADMINRSVPGYAAIIELIGPITTQLRQANCNYYDLGCSLGASMLAMGQRLDKQNANVIGVDNSQAMLNQARPMLMQASQQTITDVNYQLVCADISDIQIKNAAMVVMNFTLQFIAIKQREKLIQTIYHGLNTGGACIISEKIKLDSMQSQELMTSIHHQFKADQGYSELEISQKRDAIENVLLPESLSVHVERLKNTGFTTVIPWFQNFQFISILAVK